MKVQCPHCGHIIESKSELIRITCSSCSLKFNREENEIIGGDNNGSNENIS